MDTELYTSVLPTVATDPSFSWITVTVLYETPAPVTVTVADLGLVPVFADAAVQVTVPLFEPETGDTPNQLPSSVALQEVLEPMSNVPDDPEEDPSVMLAGDTSKYCEVPPVV